MLQLRLAQCGVFLFLLQGFCPLPGAAACPTDGDSGDGTAGQNARTVLNGRLVVAVTDLSGSDRELAKFLTDAIVTDLSRSKVWQPLERASVLENYRTLDFAPDRALSAADVRRLGTSTGADRVLVGAYILRDEQLTIDLRMLDAHTGLVIPGGATNAAGNRRDILSITHRLANQLHQRLTNTDILFEEPTSTAVSAAVAAPEHGASAIGLASSGVRTGVLDDFQKLISQGLIPQGVQPNSILTDSQLALLVKRVAKYVTLPSESASVLTQNTNPVIRIRALAALVKLIVGPDDLANYRSAPPNQLPPDAAQIPAWGGPFLSAAVDQQWWPAEKRICGKEPATWEFIVAVLTRLPLHFSSAPTETVGAREVAASTLNQDEELYTGLVIDALDMNVQRAMSPRILDEAGHILYPDANHVPEDDFVQDHGMVSYYASLPEAMRAGKHPLVIRAASISELGHDDITVTNEAAQLILEANRKSKFLWKWNVAVVAGKSQLTAKDAPPH